jgi:hypothetical protein
MQQSSGMPPSRLSSGPARLVLVAVACALGTAAKKARAGGAATDAYDGIAEDRPLDVHGLLDVYVQDAPAGSPVQFRAFDVNASPSLNFLRVTVGHHPDPVGFRIDGGVGDTPNAFLRSDPASTSYPDAARLASYVEQAFVSALVPLGDGLRIDAGKFDTPVGFEDNVSPPNLNYSRSLLFTLAEPTYHTGLRATYPVSESFAVSAFWINGWNSNVLGGNGMRSFAAAVSAKPDEALDVALVYMGGPERAPTELANPALAFRNEFDGYVRYTPDDAIECALAADYGIAGAEGGVSYWGVAGYARYRFEPWISGTLRGEYYDDPAGFTSGFRQRLVEGTATLEAKGQLAGFEVIGRLEFRRDQSDIAVFRMPYGPPSPSQSTLTMGLMASF